MIGTKQSYALISYYHARPDGSHMCFDAAHDAIARVHAVALIQSRGESASFDSAWELLRVSDDPKVDAVSLGFYDDEGHPIPMDETPTLLGLNALIGALRDSVLAYEWEAEGSTIVGRTGYGGGAVVRVSVNYDESVSADWEHNAGREESYWGDGYASPTDAAERLGDWLADL